jgi:hypothetical protein
VASQSNCPEKVEGGKMGLVHGMGSEDIPRCIERVDGSSRCMHPPEMKRKMLHEVHDSPRLECVFSGRLCGLKSEYRSNHPQRCLDRPPLWLMCRHHLRARCQEK